MRISACLTVFIIGSLGAVQGFAQEGNQDTNRINTLHESFIQSNDSKSRSLTGLALGVEFVETQPRVALQYLSNALLKLEKDQMQLERIIQYYRALAMHKLGNHGDALKMVNMLLGKSSNEQWTKRLFELKLETLFRLEDYAGVIDTYSRFSDQFALSKREEDHVKMAAQAFAKRGKRDRYIKALETLAEGYPVSESSRWAFRQLQSYSCELNGSSVYHFPVKLLTKVSRNSTLDTGLREFILAALEHPVRNDKNKVVMLSLKEQVDTLMEMRMYPEALQLGTKLYSESKVTDKNEFAWATLHVATILNRLGRSVEAMRFYSEFLRDHPGHRYTVKARRGLADTLTSNGLYLAAADQYKLLSKVSNGNLYRWGQFWNLYLAEDYTAALSLLNRPGYIKPRESSEPSSIDYWRSKILARLDQQEKAKNGFVSVLNNHGASYYSALVMNVFPELQDKQSQNSGLLPVPSHQDEEIRTVAFQGRERENSENEDFNFTNPELSLIDDLAGVGLGELASIELRGLPWSRYTQSESFFALSRLASLLGEYQPSGKVRYRPQSALRNLPKNWWSLASHQKTYQEEWKVYYPFAFQDIVEPQAEEFGVKSTLILSIMRAESRYNVHARSWVGARGLMQIMPYTGVRIARLIGDDNFEVDDLSDPTTNIRMGSFYIKRLLDYYRNNPILAVAAYNAGPIAVDRWLKHCQGCEPDEFVESIPFEETRTYVKKVMRNLVNYERIYNGRQNANFVRDLPSTLADSYDMF